MKPENYPPAGGLINLSETMFAKRNKKEIKKKK